MDLKEFEFNDKEPIYLQIIDLVKRNIALGQLKPGDKLPSVREMSSMLGVNPNTLQRAYGELERLEITYTKRGMGSFVNEATNDIDELKDEMGKGIVRKFLSDMKAIGISKEIALKMVEDMEV